MSSSTEPAAAAAAEADVAVAGADVAEDADAADDLADSPPPPRGGVMSAWQRGRAAVRMVVAPFTQLLLALRDRVRRHPVLGEIYEVVDGVFFDYGREHGAMYAGALTFYAILSLIPLTVLFASVFGFLMSSGGDAGVNAALDEVVGQLRKVLPYLEPSFADDLRVVVEYRSRLGLVGFAALLWAASEVFRGVEFATARIFANLDEHTSPHRRKTRARSVVTTKLLFGAVATAVVIAVSLLRLMATLLAEVIAKLELPGWLMSLIGTSFNGNSWLVTAAAIIIGFVVVIQVFSPHRVMMRFAFMGGGLFFMFFEAAHVVYDVYLDHITNVSAMYGSFATLIVLILWIYYCAVLLLFCCHAVKVAQRRLTVGPRWPKDGNLLLIGD